jgi:hypothetical protein
MSTQDYQDELEADLPNIIHCITAPEARDDSEAEFERIEALGSAMVGWEHKYGSDLIAEVMDLLDDMARHLVENCEYEGFENDD